MSVELLPWLHIYGSYTYHSPATIRGTREVLLSLKSSIEAALKRKPEDAEVYASDGEGYAVQVIMVSTISSLGAPEYISDAEYSLSRAKAERDRAMRLEHKRRGRG